MTGGDPLVSILIPTFDRAAMVAQAVASATGQTFGDVEIIVADNHSSDHTPEVLEGLARRDPWIRCVRHGENLGYLGNMQSLLEEARAPFVKFLMDDDVMMPDCLDVLLRPCLADGSIVLATSKRTRVDHELRPLPDVASTQAIRPDDGVLDGRQLGDLVLRTNLNVIGEASTVLFRREALGPAATALTFGAHDFEAILDVSLWLKLLAQGNAFYAATPKSLFRAHGGQGGSDYIAPFLGVIEWGRLIGAARELGFLAAPAEEVEAWATFLRAAAGLRPLITDGGHRLMLDEAVARAGDHLALVATGRGGAEERTADGRAARALREIDRAAALTGRRPVPVPAPDPSPAVVTDVGDDVDVLPGWSEALIEVLDAFPAVGAVVGARQHPDGRPAPGPGAVALRADVHRAVGGKSDLDGVRAGGWAIGFAARSVVRERVPPPASFAFDVSVVIALRNPGDALLRCLDAVADHTEEGAYEVVLVDNGSTDGTAMLLDCLEGDVQIVRHDDDRGFADACTEGVWRGRGREIVLLGADTVVTPGWLGAARAGLDAGERVGAVGVGGALLVRRTAYADAAGLDGADVSGDPVERMLGRMRRRGWTTTHR